MSEAAESAPAKKKLHNPLHVTIMVVLVTGLCAYLLHRETEQRYVFGILLAEPLNAIRIPGTGFKLGFWFAQQGSIYVFVVLIFVYVRKMNRLDREFGVHED